MTARPLTHERLLELLAYDESVGRFTRVVAVSNVAAGSEAGYLHSTGYRFVSVDGVDYKEHRLAWFYTHGVWPSLDLDHWDLDRSNNRLANLRQATHTDNMANAPLRADNRYGYKGVKPMRGRWQARIGAGGKTHLGTFDTIEEAAAAYARAADAAYGRFARVA